MQSLRSNQQTVYFSLYLGKTDISNSNGYKTGEKSKTYSKPQPIQIYVSPARGSAEVEQFGINAEYTNVMSTFDTDCPITEDSILWIGKSPFADETEETLTPYTHSVERVAKGLNSILYAVRKVSVTGTPVRGRLAAAIVNELGEFMTNESTAPITYIM